MNLFDLWENDKFSLALKHRESCHHWIDFEIFDALPDELKQKYVDQFRVPEFCMVAQKDKYQLKLHCMANHMDSMEKFRVDCSDKYPHTLKELERRFEETRCYPEKVLINESPETSIATNNK